MAPFLQKSQQEAHRMSAEENEIPVQTIAPSGRLGVQRYCRSAATKRGRGGGGGGGGGWGGGRSPELRMFSILEGCDFSPTA